MAGNDTAALVVALSAQLTKFEKDMKRAGDIADRQVSSIEDRFASLNPGLNLAKTLVPVISVAGALASIKSVVDALAELGDKSADLRLPVEEVQALGMGAQMARVSGDELNKALTTFSEVSKKNSEDGKDFYKSLSNIGQGFVNAFKNADTQSERLRILARAMASTDSEVKRAQLGLNAFGSDSERVTGYIASLATGLDTLVQRARDLGIQIDAAMVKQAQTAQTQLGTLANVISNELTISIASLIPTIVSLLPYLQQLGALARDALASFAPVASRPTETLKAEIDDSIAAVRRLDREKSELEAQAKTNSESVVSFFLTDNKAQIDAIQKKIDKEKEFQLVRSEILRGRAIDNDSGTNKPKEAPAFKPRPTLNPKAEPKDSFDKTEEQITRQTAVLNADTIAVSQNNAVRAQLRAEFQLLNALRKDGNEVTQEQIDTYTRLRASMSAENALIEARINLTPAHRQSFISASEGAKIATANFDAASSAINRLNAESAATGSALSSAFADAVLEGKELNDVLASLLKTLARGGINSIIGQIFNAPSGGGLSPAASFLGGLFNIGKNAEGTDNWRGGLTWVGEQGPEIVNVPRGAQIVPNDVARRQTSGGAVENRITVDVTGATGNAEIQRMVQAGMDIAYRRAVAAAPGAVIQHQRRMG